jgi:hypothetical protein
MAQVDLPQEGGKLKRIMKVAIDLTDEEVESWIDALLSAGASEIRVETNDKVKLVTSIEVL